MSAEQPMPWEAAGPAPTTNVTSGLGFGHPLSLPIEPVGMSPVCTVEIIVDKPAEQIRPDAASKVSAATGVDSVTLAPVGTRHTRVTLRPTAAEARSLITSAVYHDVVNGVRE